jgi:hypothetical protein
MNNHIHFNKCNQPILYKYYIKESLCNLQTEKYWNEKILKITMFIKDKYPELSKYIEEMPVTIPNENKVEITLIDLQKYYNSLASLLGKYILEHPVYNK